MRWSIEARDALNVVHSGRPHDTPAHGDVCPINCSTRPCTPHHTAAHTHGVRTLTWPVCYMPMRSQTRRACSTMPAHSVQHLHTLRRRLSPWPSPSYPTRCKRCPHTMPSGVHTIPAKARVGVRDTYRAGRLLPLAGPARRTKPLNADLLYTSTSRHCTDGIWLCRQGCAWCRRLAEAQGGAFLVHPLCIPCASLVHSVPS